MSLAPQIDVPLMDPLDLALSVTRRQTSRGEYLGANLTEGFLNSLPGFVYRMTQEPTPSPAPEQLERARQFSRLHDSPERQAELEARLQELEAATLSEPAWKASPHYRPGLDYEPGTTALSASWRAGQYDAAQYRSFLIENRRAGALDSVSGFAAQLAGGLPDPVNFIPIFGPARRVTLAGRIVERAALGAGEAAIGTAIVEPLLLQQRSRFGEDVGFMDAVADIGMSALLGSAFGGGSAAYRHWRERRQLGRLREDVRTETTALARLDQAAQDLAAGRPLDLGRAEVAPPRVPLRDADPADVAGSIEAFVTRSRDVVGRSELLRIGKVEETTATRLAAQGVDVAGFDHVMQTDEVRHILARHGEGGTALAADQLPVTAADIARVPEILRTADDVRVERTPQGLTAVVFTKREADTVVVIEEVRVGKRRLALKAMRKMKRGGEGGGPGTRNAPPGEPAEPPSLRPDREPGAAAETVGAGGALRKETRAEFVERLKADLAAGDRRLLARLKDSLAETERTIAADRAAGLESRAAAYENVRRQQQAAIADVEARLAGEPELPAEEALDIFYARDAIEVSDAVAPEAAPDPTIKAAEQRLTVADSLETRAQELGVDVRSGEFDELGEFQRLQQAGGVSEAEAAAFKAADAELKKAEAYEAGYDAAAMCLLKG